MKIEVIVRGKLKTWGIESCVSKEQYEEMMDDGVDVNIIVNSIPSWAQELGLTKMWFFVQDVFNFRIWKK